MKQSYPYPLPAHALEDYCHPLAGSGLEAPRRWEGEVVAANGYVALRAARGCWLDEDYAPADAEFAARLGKIPWQAYPGGEAWQALDLQRGEIFRYAPHGLWLKGRLAPSPVWQVCGIRVRLSLLQIIARLPRCEVHGGPQNRTEPLWFRFSGGRGCIAQDARLVMHSRELYLPGLARVQGIFSR
jgi:hypothetical protein